MTIALSRKKQLNTRVLALAVISLTALFQKLPLIPNFLKICTSCNLGEASLVYVGISYFILVILVALFLPAFPNRSVALGGLIWAVLLALTLTIVSFPHWCVNCLISHFCHIAIWGIWWRSPSLNPSRTQHSRRWLLGFGLIIPIVIAFIANYLKISSPAPIFTTGLRQGELIPTTDYNFKIGSAKGTVINFVSSNCPFCKMQLPIIDSIAQQQDRDSYRFIHIAPKVTKELIEQAPNIEWIEDEDGVLHEKFQILAHPTLFTVGADGKIVNIISGIPANLETSLLSLLKSLPPAQEIP